MNNSRIRTTYDFVFWLVIAGLAYLNHGLYFSLLDRLDVLGPYTMVAGILIVIALGLLANYLRGAIAATVTSMVISATGGKPLNYDKGSYQGNLERTARRLEKRKDFGGAGETYETLESWPQAAAAFERGGLFSRAAGCWEKAGDPHRAIELYEKERNYEMAAVRCSSEGLRERAAKNFRLAAEQAYEENLFTKAAAYYEKAGDYERAGKIFETVQKPDDALRCYEKGGQSEKVLDLLTRVQPIEVARRGSDAADMLRRCSELLAKSGSKKQAAEILEAIDDDVRAAELFESAGDFERAAQLYLKAGLVERSNAAIAKMPDLERRSEFLAKIAHAKGDFQEAGKMYEDAGKLNQAIEAYKRVRDFASAARVYEGMGRYLLAAEMYSSAKDLKSAAEAYYKAKDWRNAAECFEGAGNLGEALEAFANAGAYLKAGMLAIQLGDHGRAIEYLQRVPPASPDYRLASGYLATGFYYQGRIDMARELFRRVMDNLPISPETLVIFYAYGRLLEDDMSPDALTVYHQIMGVNVTFSDVAERIPALEAQVERMQPPPRPQSSSADLYASMPVGPATDPYTLMNYSQGSQPTIRTKTPTQTMGNVTRPRRPVTQAPDTRFGDEGRYQILEELGRGGVAIVYRAMDLHLEREVALKTFPLSRQPRPGREDVFLREARVAAKLSHPNIVTIFDSGQMNFLYYVAMEYVLGEDMRRMVKRKGPLSLTETKTVLTQFADALDYAHSMQVLHLDIKPGNIIQRLGTNSIKIVDFGMAKLMNDAATRQTADHESQATLAGTPQYMAPEYIQGHEVDSRADIYSLGLTMFFLLTGRTPFDVKKITDPLEIARMQIQSSLPRPSTLRATLPSRVDEIFLRCTQKDPDSRYQNANEFLEEIAALEATS